MNNIKLQLLLFLLMFISVSLYAQKNYREGYIITLNNDTLRGKINNNSSWSMNQKPVKIRFINSTGETKKYKANELKGYCIEDIVSYVSVRDLNEGPFFAKVLVDGTVSLMVVRLKQRNTMSVMNNPNGFSISTPQRDRYFLVNKSTSSSTYEVHSMFFKKNMSDYFSDCKELKQKIEDKEFRFDDLEIIVKKYNQCALEKEPGAN